MQTRARGGAGTNQEAVRRHNLGTLLGQVHLRGRVSRADLTTHMGLNRSTIAGLVTELESLGLAEQVRSAAVRNGAGRPSPDVVPTPDGAHVLAVDVRVDGLAVARVGLGGTVLARATGPIPASRDPQCRSARSSPSASAGSPRSRWATTPTSARSRSIFAVRASTWLTSCTSRARSASEPA